MTTDDTRSPERLYEAARDASARAYHAMIRELAEQIVSEARDNADDWREDDLSDYIHQTLDGHAWVIYTARAQMVCMVSESDGVGVEDGLIDPSEFRDCIPWSKLAYCAMEADLREEFECMGFDAYSPMTWKAEQED
jgi:hypothetical protein